MAGRKRISIVDVAERAGVSTSTVSRVLNGGKQVATEYRKRVEKAVEELDYRLSSNRPGPRPGRPVRKKRIALIYFLDQDHFSVPAHPGFVPLRVGVMNGAREQGFRVQKHFVSTETPLTDELASENARGYLLHGWRPHPSCEAFLKTKPCCWLMNNPWTPSWGDHVMPDHREVGMMAAQYLMSRGSRRPVIVKLGHRDRVQALREEGFSYAAGKKEVPFQSVTAQGDFGGTTFAIPEIVFVEQVVSQLKRMDPRPDGYFFNCDSSLAMLYPVMVREKLLVPGETPMIGCDNLRQYLSDITPSPATIEVHTEMVGLQGVAQLAWRMTHQEMTQRVRTYISPTLISG